MAEPSDKEIHKILKGKELLVYLFDKKLPLDFQPRLQAFRKLNGKRKLKNRTSDEAKRARRILTDKRYGLNPDLPITSEWQQHKLILHVTEYTCTCCRRKYSAPDSPVLIQFANPRQGKRTEIADGRGIDLPREIIRTYKETSGCSFCFDLETMIQTILDSKHNHKEALENERKESETVAATGSPKGTVFARHELG